MKGQNFIGISITILLAFFLLLSAPGGNGAIAYFGYSATGNLYGTGATLSSGLGLGGLYGGYGLYGGLYGGYGLYGGAYGLGGLYGGYGLYGGSYGLGGLYGSYGLYGGSYGLGGLYGGYGLYGGSYGLGGLYGGYGLYGGSYGRGLGYGGIFDLGLSSLLNPLGSFGMGRGLFNLWYSFDPLIDPLMGLGLFSGGLL